MIGHRIYDFNHGEKYIKYSSDEVKIDISSMEIFIGMIHCI
jgi:hypothetical protein